MRNVFKKSTRSLPLTTLSDSKMRPPSPCKSARNCRRRTSRRIPCRCPSKCAGWRSGAKNLCAGINDARCGNSTTGISMRTRRRGPCPNPPRRAAARCPNPWRCCAGGGGGGDVSVRMCVGVRGGCGGNNISSVWLKQLQKTRVVLHEIAKIEWILARCQKPRIIISLPHICTHGILHQTPAQSKKTISGIHLLEEKDRDEKQSHTR